MKNRYIHSQNFILYWDDKNNSKKILDAGAGEQRIKKYIQNNHYISQDFGQYEADNNSVPADYKGTWNKKWDSKKCDIICDITDIPLESGSIDLIVNLEVLEHLPEPVKALKEFHRILKIGGKLLITCPNLCTPHQTPFFFYSGFSRQFFCDYIPSITNLKLIEFREEGDILLAHLNEINALNLGIKNFLIRNLYKLISKTYLKLIRFLLSITRSSIPESGSGFFILYEKFIT